MGESADFHAQPFLHQVNGHLGRHGRGHQRRDLLQPRRVITLRPPDRLLGGRTAVLTGLAPAVASGQLQLAHRAVPAALSSPWRLSPPATAETLDLRRRLISLIQSLSPSQSNTLHQLSGRPWVHWGDGYDRPTAYTGAAGLKQVLEHGLAQPLALASADFDKDGLPDVVSGYAGLSGGIVTLHRGNLYSIYPIIQGRVPATGDQRPATSDPFLPEARVFETPEAPEFLGAGDFDNDEHWDVVAAARGSDAL